MPETRLYFHSLDALRFLAFFRVFLLHLPQNEDNPFLATLFSGGEIGVDLFFVLSGFLITYLLCSEINRTGTIHKKAYLARRTLRIWPLYFLGVAIAYAGNYITAVAGIGGTEGYQPHPFFSLSFLENYRMIYLDTFPNGAPLRAFWSLCVEEHFYVLWLLLFVFVKPAKMPLAFLTLWICAVLYRVGFYQLYPHKAYYDLDVISKLDYFCLGGLSGYYLCYKYDQLMVVMKKISARIRSAIILLILFFLVSYQFIFQLSRVDAIYFPIISAVLFSVLILIIVSFEKSYFSNTKNIFNKMGKISFGLYVYHTVVISVLLVIANRIDLNIKTSWLNYTIFCTACFVLTLIISSISYKYFESFFLKLKKKYTIN